MKRKKRFDKHGNSRLYSIINLSKFLESKRSQQILGLSFGIIFSIILIIFLIIISFIVVKSFLSAQNCAKIGIFADKFNSDIKKTWNSPIDRHTFKGILPSKVKKVCFADLSLPAKNDRDDILFDLGLFEGRNANMFIYPSNSACEIPFHNIPWLNIEKIIVNENPYCLEVIDGIIEIDVEKNLNDRLVMVYRS